MTRQTFRSVVIYYGESHGRQLYFDMSFARNSNNMKVFIKQTTSQWPMLNDGRVWTWSSFYTEIFCD